MFINHAASTGRWVRGTLACDHVTTYIHSARNNITVILIKCTFVAIIRTNAYKILIGSCFIIYKNKYV